MVPHFRKGVPLGQPVLLNNDEFKQVIIERAENEKKWKRHIDRLNLKKKPENGVYEIKTPIPSHPDRCFICQCNIPESVGYKEHLKTD